MNDDGKRVIFVVGHADSYIDPLTWRHKLELCAERYERNNRALDRIQKSAVLAVAEGMTAAQGIEPEQLPPDEAQPPGKPFRGRVVGYAPIEPKVGSSDRSFRDKSKKGKR